MKCLLMSGFKKVESLEDFKFRLNSLTEKINKINQNSNASAVGDNQRIRVREA